MQIEKNGKIVSSLVECKKVLFDASFPEIDASFTIEELEYLRRLFAYYCKRKTKEGFLIGSHLKIPGETMDGKMQLVKGKMISIEKTRAAVFLDESKKVVSVPFGQLRKLSDSDDLDQREKKPHRKRKKRKGSPPTAISSESDEIPVRRPRKQLYKSETQVLRENLSSKLMPSRVSGRLFSIPCSALPVLSSLQGKGKDKEKERLVSEKKHRYEAQVLQYKNERASLAEGSPAWKHYNPADNACHFVFVREGVRAIKWFPQEGENLMSLCCAMRDLLFLSKAIKLYFTQAAETVFTSGKVIPLNPKPLFLPLEQLGSTFQKGSVVDLVLPAGVMGKWSVEVLK